MPRLGSVVVAGIKRHAMRCAYKESTPRAVGNEIYVLKNVAHATRGGSCLKEALAFRLFGSKREETGHPKFVQSCANGQSLLTKIISDFDALDDIIKHRK